jgi:hypothetical protein
MANNNPRLQLAREDLKTQITDIYASPGTILVVHPKNDVQFNTEFSQWLADTLQSLLPIGVQGMVLSENLTDFHVESPDSNSVEYLQGWRDAIQAIAAKNA